MLFFARPRKPTFKVVDLESIVIEVLDFVAPLLNSRKVDIERSTVTCPIHGDSELLKQVFMNIVTNAMQAMPDGGLIGITLTRSEMEGTVHISDSGEGIALENVEKIFDPFFTTKDSALASDSRLLRTSCRPIMEASLLEAKLAKVARSVCYFLL